MKEIHIVSLKNECKEVLYLLKKYRRRSSFTLYRYHFNRSSASHISQENETAPLSDPLDYLYEANASILKAGAFNSIANFNLRKLHPNSHLYTSHRLIENFLAAPLNLMLFVNTTKKNLLNTFRTKKPISLEEISGFN